MTFLCYVDTLENNTRCIQLISNKDGIVLQRLSSDLSRTPWRLDIPPGQFTAAELLGLD